MSLFGTNTVASHWGWQNRESKTFAVLDMTFTGTTAQSSVGGDEFMNWEFSSDYAPASVGSSPWAYSNTGISTTSNTRPSVATSQVSNLFYAATDIQVQSPVSPSIASSSDGTNWEIIGNVTYSILRNGTSVFVRNGNSVRFFYERTSSQSSSDTFVRFADILGNSLSLGSVAFGQQNNEIHILRPLGYVGNVGYMSQTFGGSAAMNPVRVYKLDNTNSTSIGTLLPVGFPSARGDSARPSFAYFSGGNTGYKYFAAMNYVDSNVISQSILRSTELDTSVWTTRTVSGVDRFSLFCASPTVLLARARTISTGVEGLYRTTNGVNWTLSSILYRFSTLNYDGSRFIGRALNLSDGPSGAGIYTSTDGVTWDFDPTTITMALNDPDTTLFAELNGVSIFRARLTGSETGDVVIGNGTTPTSYNITLPAHETYSTQSITFTPTVGLTPSQQASALGSQITTLRNTYSASYPSSGVVTIDTNSAANIPDVFQIQNGTAPTGNLVLSVTQGSNAQATTRDTISITDPVTNAIYQYSPAYNESLPALVTGIVSGETLPNWTSVVQQSNTTTGTIRFTSANVGYIIDTDMPSVSITPGTNSTLTVSSTVISNGS
jgi:hypothetical protein